MALTAAYLQGACCVGCFNGRILSLNKDFWIGSRRYNCNASRATTKIVRNLDNAPGIDYRRPLESAGRMMRAASIDYATGPSSTIVDTERQWGI